nr:MAG TPA: Major capsid protein [Caudoviricetes sp.]
MPNMIELVNKYLPVLDAQYRQEARSAILDVRPEFVQMTRDAKKVKIAKMRVDGLADYSRANGFTAGYADLTWEEHEFTQDRGRAIQIDDMDNEETFGMAFGRLAGEFQRLHVIPEIDAYRFAKYYQKAATHLEFTVSSGAILNLVDDFDSQMDDDEVPEDGRILFVAPSVFKLMVNDPALEKYISVEGGEDKTVNKRFYYYNGHPIIKVPAGRFYTEIELLDGKTQGEEVGGYKAATGAKAIGMLMVSREAVIQLAKRRIARVWAPTRAQAAGTDGVNPDADAWKFDYRVYHDAWVLDEKTKGIAGATIINHTVTSVEIYSEDQNVTIESNAATVSMATVPDGFQLRAQVTFTGGASTAVKWSDGEGHGTVGTIDSNGNVTLTGTGTYKVTATSVWDPSVSDTVTFTVNA